MAGTAVVLRLLCISLVVMQIQATYNDLKCARKDGLCLKSRCTKENPPVPGRALCSRGKNCCRTTWKMYNFAVTTTTPRPDPPLDTWPTCQRRSGTCQSRKVKCLGTAWNGFTGCRKHELCCIKNTQRRDRKCIRKFGFCSNSPCDKKHPLVGFGWNLCRRKGRFCCQMGRPDKCPFVPDSKKPSYYYLRDRPDLRERCAKGLEFVGGSYCACKKIQISNEEKQAKEWLKSYNAEIKEYLYESANTQWKFNTNLTVYNQQQAVKATEALAAYIKAASVEAAAKFNWTHYSDPLIKDELDAITAAGIAALSADDFKKLSTIQGNMLSTYSLGKVCNKPGDTSNKCYPLSPDLNNIMGKSTNADVLLWAWKGWRDATGAKMPDSYKQYVDLLNKASKLNDYSDHSVGLKWVYQKGGEEIDPKYDFEADIERLWLEMRPLYKQLHAYARRRLMERYSHLSFPESGHIPAHLLGDMWAQEWKGIASLLEPYPRKTIVDVTAEMKRQNYTVERIFKTAEQFYTSLGLKAMTPGFWSDSIFKKPTDRNIVCHPTGWNFYNGKDFRIIQCTEISMHHLLVAHHEMGHIQHYMQYSHLPVNFQQGANPGFSEAIGDVLSMSVSTPQHLHKIGLLPNYKPDPQVDLNFLMSQATAIAFLPFGYLLDKWRWDVFAGKTTRDEYNKKWWDARCHYQGVSPPVARNSSDFDPGAKMHIPADVPYIRYFVGSVLQFQMQKALCKAAGHKGALYKCDIYQSKAAGTLLRKIMEVGSTISWPECLQMITGSKVMSAKPLLSYFWPLRKWLKCQNKGHSIGWKDACPPGSFV